MRARPDDSFVPGRNGLLAWALTLVLFLAGCAHTPIPTYPQPDRYPPLPGSGSPSGSSTGSGGAEAARVPSERETSVFSRPPFGGLQREKPLTASGALGRVDSARDASLRLVISGLDEDAAGRPGRALASYQRAVRVDSTNPFAYLALARHHVEGDSTDEANAFLDQARSLFEAEDRMGPSVDVWGIGLRAWIDRARGREDLAGPRFEAARQLSPEIWRDERLSAAELR
ncbi:MAG: type IV pilus biogenesis/stability protein PilW [Myxococcota bacterium]